MAFKRSGVRSSLAPPVFIKVRFYEPFFIEKTKSVIISLVAIFNKLTEVCMKKILFTFLCLAVCGNAFAKDHKKGFIFVPENVVIETVENVKTKADETFVYMQGQIVKALGDEKYAFIKRVTHHQYVQIVIHLEIKYLHQSYH